MLFINSFLLQLLIYMLLYNVQALMIIFTTYKFVIDIFYLIFKGLGPNLQFTIDILYKLFFFFFGLFFMGLIKYGKGKWRKSSKHYLGNKTP